MFPFAKGRKKASDGSSPTNSRAVVPVVPKRGRKNRENRHKTDWNINTTVAMEEETTQVERRPSEIVSGDAVNYELGHEALNSEAMIEINNSQFALPFRRNRNNNPSSSGVKYANGTGTLTRNGAKKHMTQSSEERDNFFRSKSDCFLNKKEDNMDDGDNEGMAYNNERADLTDSLATWDIIDAAEDKELIQVKKDLTRMPNLTRNRTDSIMNESKLYQDQNVTRSNGSESETESTNNLADTNPGDSDTLESDSPNLLGAIMEESVSPKPSPGLVRSMRMPISRREHKQGLWCEQENVIKSGILDRLTEGELKLQEALFEVITTEESNLKSLGILVSHFKASLEHSPTKASKTNTGVALRASKEQERKGILNKYETNQLFFNIEMIKECSEKFLAIVEKKQGKLVLVQNYLDQFTEHVNSVLSKSIIKYCSNISHQREILANLTNNNVVFAEKIRQLETDSKLNDKTFKSFLIVPMNRICHLPLLVEKIVKVSGKLSDDYSVSINKSANKAYDVVKTVASQCNQETRKLEDYAQQQSVLLAIERRLIIPLEIKLNLITAARTLLCECNATQVVESNSLFRNNQEINLNLKLFNDILLICKPAQDLFIVLDVADVRGGSVHISELTEENEADFLSRAKFLSASHRQKRPISLVFFRTKLGDFSSMKASETNPMGSNVDLRATSSNCFQDHAHVFIISPDKRDVFVSKLRSCLVDKRVSTDDETERVAKVGRRKSSFIGPDMSSWMSGGGTLGRRSSLKSANGSSMAEMAAIEQITISDTKGLSGSSNPNVDLSMMQEAPKIVPISSNAAFTPLLQRNNLVRWTSSIQLSQSSQYESTYEQDAQ